METDNFVNLVREKYKDEDIKVILDLGSRDGLQSVEFRKHYPNALILAFEPNEETWFELMRNVEGHDIKVFPFAVGNQDGSVKFYRSIHGNPGSSSVYQKSGKYDYIENYVQKEVTVRMIKLDKLLKDLEVDKVDLVWADMQGSELNAFKGMGDYLKDVKGIMTEVEYKEMYKDQPLYPEVKEFLESKGFTEKWKKSVHDDFFGEAIFIR